MPTPILATKLYLPRPRPGTVVRPRLIERLNQSLVPDRVSGLTLVSAAAGFGKTTLVSAWIGRLRAPVRAAWLSLDEGENDPARFLAYLVAALQTAVPEVGHSVAAALQSPQPPPAEALLTPLLNELVALPHPLVLVLDDYHEVDAPAVDEALAFLLDHLPPPLRLVVATREDPDLPLARLRARGQLAELRAADLRFTPAEAADFLKQAMGLRLSEAEVAALEHRTEGWIAGLQLAALSLQHQPDAARFIREFTGSHHFVLDYLVEEVLHQQPAAVQQFLLRTSMLERLCGPLCDAVLLAPPGTGQATLEQVERANLFVVPLDNERRWYRYHHLFGDLLRQRLQQAAGAGGDTPPVAELHLRASQWFEDHGLDVEAFRHAAAANDIDRAERIIEGNGLPLHLRGAVGAVLDWLERLPAEVLNARPWLYWRHAAMLLVSGHTTGVQEKLDAAEAALPPTPPDDRTRLLVGRIAAARAVLALTRYQADTLLAQSRRALDHLPAANRSLRANAFWTLGMGHLFKGERAPARAALTEALALSQASNDLFTGILSTIAMASLQESSLEYHPAMETYQHVLRLVGDQPQQIIHEVHLGLGRIHYERNDLDAAEQHGQQALHLARQYDRVIDRFIICEVFLARVRLARGDAAGAWAMLARTEQAARQPNFAHRLPEVAAQQVLVLLRQGDVATAAQLAQTYQLPPSLARVALAQGETAAALTALEAWRQVAEARDWPDERLRALALLGLAHHTAGDMGQALDCLDEALALAAPSGLVRPFVDEGQPMAQLLSTSAARGLHTEYARHLLAAFGAEPPSAVRPASPLVEPLSQRELEVLQLIAQGLSNQEISQRLFLALDTVKGHNRRIFEKLQVQRRTEAVARARELGLL